jgi:hypothetical protein
VYLPVAPEWRNGRRSGLKIHRGQPRASSNLASGTPPAILHPSRSVPPSLTHGVTGTLLLLVNVRDATACFTGEMTMPVS